MRARTGTSLILAFGCTVLGGLVTASADESVPAEAEAAAAAAEAAATGPEPEPPPEDPGWEGKFLLGATVRAGNEDAYSVTGALDLSRKWREVNEFKAHLEGSYGHSSGEDTEDSQFLKLEYRRYLRPRFFLYGDALAGRDGIADIRYRIISTVGPGWRVWEVPGETARYLDLKTGVGYRRVEYTDGSDERNDGLVTASMDYKNTWGPYLEYGTENSVYFPVNDPDGVGGRSASFFSLPLSETLRFRNVLEVEWNNDPADDAEKWDLKFVSGIEYAF